MENLLVVLSSRLISSLKKGLHDSLTHSKELLIG